MTDEKEKRVQKFELFLEIHEILCEIICLIITLGIGAFYIFASMKISDPLSRNVFISLILWIIIFVIFYQVLLFLATHDKKNKEEKNAND